MRTGREPFISRLPAARKAAATVLAALALGCTLVACGNNAPEAAPTAAGNLLSSADLEAYREGTVERSFLDYWSALQYQSWADVAAYYSSDFRQFVGTSRIISAKMQNASTFPLLKPEIASVREEPRESTIFYTLRFADGTKEQSSTTWRREDGNWQMIYDSRLNPELAQLARNQVEIRENGALPVDASQPSSPAATKAGDRASRIQGEFLEQDLKAATD